MGVIKEIVLLPAAPVRLSGEAVKFSTWVADKVAEEAEREHFSTGAGVRKLQEIEDAREEGRLDEEQAAELEAQVLEQQLEAAQSREGGGLGLPSRGPSKT